MTRRARPSPTARGYGPDWVKLRNEFVAWWRDQAHPCAICGAAFKRAQRIEVDHIKPIRERPDLRLDWFNLRGLCSKCHRLHTAREATSKARGYHGGVDSSGKPTDPRHPWYRGGASED